MQVILSEPVTGDREIAMQQFPAMLRKSPCEMIVYDDANGRSARPSRTPAGGRKGQLRKRDSLYSRPP